MELSGQGQAFLKNRKVYMFIQSHASGFFPLVFPSAAFMPRKSLWVPRSVTLPPSSLQFFQRLSVSFNSFFHWDFFCSGVWSSMLLSSLLFWIDFSCRYHSDWIIITLQYAFVSEGETPSLFAIASEFAWLFASAEFFS